MQKIIGHRQPNRKSIQPSEHDEQVIVCKYLNANNIKYYAVPNGFYTSERNKAKKFGLINKFRAEGVKKGVPDLVVFLNNKIVYIEMKKRQGGTVSKEQKAWINFINTTPYARAYVCKGASEALGVIEESMRGS